jgi:hypothetical protein
MYILCLSFLGVNENETTRVFKVLDFLSPTKLRSIRASWGIGEEGKIGF